MKIVWFPSKTSVSLLGMLVILFREKKLTVKLKVSKETFIDKIGLSFDITRSGKVPAPASVKLKYFCFEEPDTDGRFREIEGGFTCLAY